MSRKAKALRQKEHWDPVHKLSKYSGYKRIEVDRDGEGWNEIDTNFTHFTH